MKRIDPPAGQLGLLVYRLMAAMHRHDAGRTLPVLHAAGLTTPQLAVLEFTRRPRTVSAIGTWLGLSRPATSQLVEKLVCARLVRRIESETDRRERNVTLSPKGLALVEKIAAARIARFQISLASLAPAVATRFERVLAEVVDALGEPDPPPWSRGRKR